MKTLQIAVTLRRRDGANACNLFTFAFAQKTRAISLHATTMSRSSTQTNHRCFKRNVCADSLVMIGQEEHKFNDFRRGDESTC